MAEFMSFKEDMIEWRQTMERTANVKSSNEITPSKFLEEHGLTKLITVEDFQTFDNRLKMDADFHKDFVSFRGKKNIRLMIFIF